MTDEKAKTRMLLYRARRRGGAPVDPLRLYYQPVTTASSDVVHEMEVSLVIQREVGGICGYVIGSLPFIVVAKDDGDLYVKVHRDPSVGGERGRAELIVTGGRIREAMGADYPTHGRMHRIFVESVAIQLPLLSLHPEISNSAFMLNVHSHIEIVDDEDFSCTFQLGEAEGILLRYIKK